MYKVIIIDDEEAVVDELKKAADWKRYGCTVVASACDASSGAVAVRTYEPEILFTDIRMPGQDGLTMLAGLRSEFPDMRVTVLTGFNDFEYAQRVIEFGVSRRLLKPFKMDEINEALRFMTDKLSEKNGISQQGEKEDSVEITANSFIVRKATAYMEEHYAEKLTLQDVADQCYVSQWHLSKLINKNTQMSFYDLLNHIRIKAACRLLDDPEFQIADICYKVGYADTAHFSRIFKKVEGITADEYRNQRKRIN